MKRVTILSVRLRPLERLVDVPDVGAHAKQYLQTESKVKQVVQKHHGSIHNATAGRFLISFNVLTPCTTQVQNTLSTHAHVQCYLIPPHPPRCGSAIGSGGHNATSCFKGNLAVYS